MAWVFFLAEGFSEETFLFCGVSVVVRGTFDGVTSPFPLIQVDIGGHPPIPLGPTPLFLSIFSVSLIVAQFTIVGSFSGPQLPEPF